jgi:hypothetical protein
MRIAFTLKIAPVISQADVSHNGLFIGLWTEAEVSLGFIVACSLCLPKLIQAKGRRLRNALSYASAPWSSLTSKSRKSSLWSRSGSRKSTGFEDKERGIEVERPMYYEEREEQKKLAQARLQPEKNRHDIYVLPSTAGNSECTPSRDSLSRYSQSSSSKHSGQDEDALVQTATILRHQIPRTISVRTQEVPVKLDEVPPMMEPEPVRLDSYYYMSPEQLEEERRALQQFDFESFAVVIDGAPRRLTS